MRKLLFIAVFPLLLFFCEKKITLVKEGKPQCVIVVEQEPDSIVQYSSEFLRKYLKEMTGADIEIRKEPVTTQSDKIILKNLKRFQEQDLEEDEFFIIAEKNTLTIVGGPDKGVLYGVITLLEQFGGCRALAPGSIYVPQKNDFYIPKVKIHEKPAANYRVVNGQFCADQDYMDWRRLDQINDMFAKGYYVHTFERLVPREKYFQEHPEYFAEMNGRRRHQQLCLSNPEVMKIVKDRLREEMEKQPEKIVWSVSQNDNFEYCQCPECSKIIEEEKAPSGTIIRFVNEIAREFPDKIISTLAYQYSR